MDKSLLEILACPICKGELLFDRQTEELICRFDRKVWPVVNNIPIMLESQSRRLDVDE